MIFSNYISIKKRSLMRSNQIIIEYTRISDFKAVHENPSLLPDIFIGIRIYFTHTEV